MLISFLCDNLREHGFTIREARAGPDTFIVKEAVKGAKEKDSIAVVHADDADVFVYVCSTAKMFRLKFSFKPLKRLKTITVKFGVVTDVNEKVDDYVLDNILFRQAWTGCDTSSGTYGMGNESL